MGTRRRWNGRRRYRNENALTMFSEFFGIALASISGGVAVYVGIRSDLAEMRARITIVEKVSDKAHDRIDNLDRCKT